MLNWLVDTSSNDMTTITWNLIGTILMCVIAGIVILLAWKLTFPRACRLMTGAGLKPLRFGIAAGIYVPLFAGWISHIVDGKAELREWIALIAFLIFLNYVPVNLLSHILDDIAAHRRSAEYVIKKAELKEAKEQKKRIRKLEREMKAAADSDSGMTVQEKLEKKAEMLAEIKRQNELKQSRSN